VRKVVQWTTLVKLVLMGGVAQLQVPLLVELGGGMNWDEAH
jgi:DNA polymerase I-like protein with 3'-5' exonuclease and polymerase domains